MFNRHLDVPNLSCVFPDYEDAAQQSVGMLLDRGYERLEGKLKSLGARIGRQPAAD